jgi:hypothetical protein
MRYHTSLVVSTSLVSLSLSGLGHGGEGECKRQFPRERAEPRVCDAGPPRHAREMCVSVWGLSVHLVCGNK